MVKLRDPVHNFVTFNEDEIQVINLDTSKTSANILAVTHVTVVDATGAAPLPDRTILITDDLITGIGRSEDIHLPTNARVVTPPASLSFQGFGTCTFIGMKRTFLEHA